MTLDTSHREMSSLNLRLWRNRELMSVMAEVSHDAMGPYLAFAAARSVHHASTAVWMPPSWSRAP